MLRWLGALAFSLAVTAFLLTLVRAVTGDLAWWQDDVWVRAWLGVALLTAIPTGAATRR